MEQRSSSGVDWGVGNDGIPMTGISVTSVTMTGYCHYCSQPALGHYIFHGGMCPKVKAMEYYPGGGVKRVVFHSDEYKPECETECYTIIDGELRRIVDGEPPGSIPFSPDSGLFNLRGEDNEVCINCGEPLTEGVCKPCFAPD